MTKARWETYEDEIVGRDTPEMQAAVAEYAKNRHEGSSQQNSEELARWKEGNAEIAKQYQWVHPSEYADEPARIGKILSRDELINTLRNKCKLKCFYREMGHPQKLALWVYKDGTEPEVGCWVQSPYMPEFSIIRFDDHGVPLDEKMRGWRTVLMQLALKKFLKETTINKVFGRANGPASEKYNAFMHSLRQNS
jgi:hypothetical protein